jgi:hypothetical protein
MCGSVTDEMIELELYCNHSVVIIKWTNRNQQPLVYATNRTFTIAGVLECYSIHTEKSNKMQQYQNLLFHIYMKPNMFRPTRHPSSGA